MVSRMPRTWTTHEGSGKRVTGKVDQVGVKDGAPEWAQQQWRVTLRCEGRTMSLDYYGGGACSDPSIGDIVETLDLDTYAGTVSFEDYCAEYGEDSDSRRAYAMWQACVKQSKRFARLIGM